MAPHVNVDASLHTMATFLHLLKHLPRTGWAARGLSTVESVASHSHGAAIWACWLAQRSNLKRSERIDQRDPIDQSDRGASAPTEGSPLQLEKVLKMALLHDLPEAVTGDLMPSQKESLFGPSKDAQREAIAAAEARFWETLLMPFAQKQGDTDKAIFEDWRSLWAEYREGETPEAKIVKQADALDCVMQAIVYQELHERSLSDFARLIEKAAGDDPQLKEELQAYWRQSLTPKDLPF